VTYQKVPRPVHFCNCGDHAWSTLTKGYVTLVSPEDAHFLQERAWTAKADAGKKVVYARSTYRRLHRKIVAATSSVIVDHESGNGLDNRRHNLRETTIQQNCQNGTAHKDSTSKFKGVSWYKDYQKWRVSIYVSGKQKCLGYFDDEETAAEIYDEAALKHFGPYARLNFV